MLIQPPSQNQKPEEILHFKKIILDWELISTDQINSVPELAGIYQIYGTSPLYGVNTILYIGIGDNLRQRLNSHEGNRGSFITRQPNRSIRYAIPNYGDIKVIEAILIVMHKPAFNSKNIINIPYEAKKELIYIQNHGDRGLLNLEVTNYYFWSDRMRPILINEAGE